MDSMSKVIDAFADQPEARAAAMLAALDEDELRQVLEAFTDEERAALAEFTKVPGDG